MNDHTADRGPSVETATDRVHTAPATLGAESTAVASFVHGAVRAPLDDGDARLDAAAPVPTTTPRATGS